MVTPFHKQQLLGLTALAALGGAALMSGHRTDMAAAGKPKLDATIKVHPLLQYGAQAEPDKKVRVLVTRQKDADKQKDKGKERDIAGSVGADDEEDFSIAGVQSLLIKQKDVYKLAGHKDVVFVSPDGDVGSPDTKGKRGAVDTHGPAKAGVVATKPAAAQPVPDPASLTTTFPRTVGADRVWRDREDSATGKGITVAVLDTGIAVGHPDFTSSDIISVTANRRALGADDAHGHGTHVAGIINGRSADGSYVGVAPGARVISVKVADDAGHANESDLLRGLQWVYDNRVTYDIRAVNLSVSAATPSSYATSAISQAVEQLWFSGVVVVAAAGNDGSAKDAAWHAPANDPYVLTVGCTDENATPKTDDDTQCTFSSRGTTQDGFTKPDVLAPGRRIVAPLSSITSTLAASFPDRVMADRQHIRLSGTSASAPVVTGLVALLLEDYPTLTPDQVKAAIVAGARPLSGGATRAGQADAGKSMDLTKDGKAGRANQGLTPASAIAVRIAGASAAHTASSSAGAPAGGGTPAAAGPVNPAQTYWDQTYWDQTYWDQTYWDTAANID